MTLQRRLLAKLRLHLGAMAGLGASSTCLLVAEPIGLDGWDCRSRDDLPITPATSRETVPDTVSLLQRS